MVKIGIVGARGFSTVMGLKARDDVQITGLCDLDAGTLERGKKELGLTDKQVFRVFEDMLESDIDAVIIATPMQCHVPQAIAALRAGKHVMSEVTAGVTMDELWWLIENVEKSGKIYMYAENYCYMPDIQLVRNLKRKGFFGDIYYGEGEYTHDCKDLRQYGNGKVSWRHYWQFGKRGSFYPTHSLGPVMLWFDDDRVKSIASFGPGCHNGVGLRQDDLSQTLCQLESGKLVKIRVDCMSNRPHCMTYYQLQGTKGAYEAPRGLGDVAKIAVATDDNPTGYTEWRPLSDFNEYLPERYKVASESEKGAGHGGGDFFIVEDFINAINTNTQPELDVYKACEWTAVGLLSELSITNNGRVMEMPNFRKNMPYAEQIIKL